MSSSSEEGQQPPSKKLKDEDFEEFNRSLSFDGYFSDDGIDNIYFPVGPVCHNCGSSFELDYDADPPICYHCETRSSKKCWECDEPFQDFGDENICATCMRGDVENFEEGEDSNHEWSE